MNRSASIPMPPVSPVRRRSTAGGRARGAGLFAACLALCVNSPAAQTPSRDKPLREPPPPVTPLPAAVAPAPAAAPAQTFVYQQQPLAGRPTLVSREQAQAVIDRFKAALPRLGNPRMLVFVNRELIDDRSGLKLTGVTETSAKSQTDLKSNLQLDPNAPRLPPSTGSAVTVNIGGTSPLAGTLVAGDVALAPGKSQVASRADKTTRENTYKYVERTPPTLADKQTTRDLERLFGRPLRMAGTRLADQRVASQMLPGNPLQTAGAVGDSDQARRDREALTQVADVVVEVLLSSRNLTVNEVSGAQTYAAPDIQATAIRVRDARILGQATAADIIGLDRYAARVVRNFDVREIAEATALALMEDMLLSGAD